MGLLSIPLAHSVHPKKNYDSIKIYGIQVGSYWKPQRCVTGMQGGYSKHSCYLCLWDSRNNAAHYQQKHWPVRTEYEVGKYNIK